MPAIAIGVVVLVIGLVIGVTLGSNHNTVVASPTTSDQSTEVTEPTYPAPSVYPSEDDSGSDSNGFDDSGSPVDPTPTTESTEPTDETSAQAALDNEVAQDKAAAEQLVDQWVPQLSSKQPGLVADGVDYDYQLIWQNFQQLQQQYSNVLLIWSGNYTSFKSADFYVTIVDQPYSDDTDANQWCDQAGIDNNDCYAKLISHTAGPQGATVLRQ